MVYAGMNMLRSGRFFFAAAGIGLFAACASVPQPELNRTGDCEVLLARFERQVATAGVADAEYARIAGFPLLRIDRLLAALAAQGMPESSEPHWWRALRRLDAEARRIEYHNLPPRARQALPGDILSRLERCGETLLASLQATPQRRQHLLAEARVPDAYVAWQRVVGLYPLTSSWVAWRIRQLQARLQADFDTPLAELPVAGTLRRYILGPLSLDGPEPPLPVDNIWHIPVPGRAELARLLRRHAPIFEIDVLSDDDRPGALAWGADGKPLVRVDQPALYWRLSWARLGGRWRLQLNYMIWFPARTAQGPFDIYAGRLDSLIWRVTLDQQGEPLFYDSVHGCGCYHQFYPLPGTALTASAEALPEPPWVPQTVNPPGPGERIVVRLAHGNHYVQRVYRGRPARRDQALAGYSYHRLRALPRGQARRSVFQPNGLVAGTQRPERWLLWPMGVRSAGAMRQWGHHAVAFVGRRHFDDSDLFDSLFVITPEEYTKAP